MARKWEALPRQFDTGRWILLTRAGQWLSQDIKTYPSTASYQGGVLKATGFRVFDIKEVKVAGGDTNMQFSVMFAGQPMPPTVVPTQAPTFAQVQYRTESRNIMSTFSGGSGSYGNMFDVKAVPR